MALALALTSSSQFWHIFKAAMGNLVCSEFGDKRDPAEIWPKLMGKEEAKGKLRDAPGFGFPLQNVEMGKNGGGKQLQDEGKEGSKMDGPAGMMMEENVMIQWGESIINKKRVQIHIKYKLMCDIILDKPE